MGFLTGKTAIVTGGGHAVLSDGRCGSIGYGIATAYAKEGANLVITGRNMSKLEKAKEELERLYGVKVLALAADICAGADNEAIAKSVVGPGQVVALQQLQQKAHVVQSGRGLGRADTDQPRQMGGVVELFLGPGQQLLFYVVADHGGGELTFA